MKKLTWLSLLGFGLFVGLISCWAVPTASAQEKTLTLDEALAKALSVNPDIIASRETAEAAGYRVGEALSGYFPQAAAVLGYKRATANAAAGPWVPKTVTSPTGKGTIPNPSAKNSVSGDSWDNYSASISVTENVYDFGKTGGAYDSADALAKAARNDMTTAVETTYLNVTQAYFVVLAAQETLATARDTKKQMEYHLDLAQQQYTVGIRQKIDVLRAQSDLAAANLSLVQAENAQALARSNLNTAIGLNQPADYRVEKPAATPTITGVNIEEAYKDALARRSDYESLQEKVVAAQAAITVARSGYFPALGVNGSYNYTGYETNDLVPNWNVGATLTWNFFSGLLTYRTMQEAEANLRALQAQKLSLELAIRSDVESAVLGYQEALAQLTPAQALYDSAKETLTMAEERYKAGIGGIVEITDAQTVYTQAATGLIQANYNRETARAKLLKALGKISPTKAGDGK